VVPGQRLSQASASANGARAGASADGGASAPAAAPTADHVALLFDDDKLRNAVTHANDMTIRYGVEVLSINIISAKPAECASGDSSRDRRTPAAT
jgi:hypothetical protein